MFDKWKDRKKRLEESVAKFEETHEGVRKTHQHLVKHQTKYACGATAVVCVVGPRLVGGANGHEGMKQLLETNPRNGGFLYKSTQIINNTVTQEMVRQGDPGKKTFWVEKGVWFPSRKAAAIAADVSHASVSKCCDGVIDSVKGQHFVDGGHMV